MNKNLILSQIMESEKQPLLGLSMKKWCWHYFNRKLSLQCKMILRYVDIFGTPLCSIIRRLILQYTWYEIQRTTTQSVLKVENCRCRVLIGLI